MSYLLSQLMQDFVALAKRESRKAVAPFTTSTGKLNRATSNAVGKTPIAGGGTGHDQGAEPPLGTPATDGEVLSSTAAGVRSWFSIASAIAAALAAAELDDLGDVTIVDPQEGHRLVYRDGQWRNAPAYRERAVTNGDLDFPEIVFDAGDVVYEPELLL